MKLPDSPIYQSKSYGIQVIVKACQSVVRFKNRNQYTSYKISYKMPSSRYSPFKFNVRILLLLSNGPTTKKPLKLHKSLQSIHSSFSLLFNPGTVNSSRIIWIQNKIISQIDISYLYYIYTISTYNYQICQSLLVP